MKKKDATRSPSQDEKSCLTRRRFLVGGTGFASALAVPRGATCKQAQGRGQAQKQSSKASKYYESFSEPLVEYSRDGILRTTLRVTEADITIREANALRVVRTRCYNGHVPGPTLKMRPGEVLRLKLINELPTNADSDCGKEHNNQPHCFNTTNIHTHGLHVSPKAPSDNSFLKIEPQTEYEYCFQVPKFHLPGTYWYHAHVHGSTALQVMNGMAGALIIEEPEEQQVIPEAKDLIWLLQEVMGKEAEKLYTCNHPDHSIAVNGRSQPTLRMRPNEIQRCRFINATATPGGYVNLQLLDGGNKLQEMFMIAVDGHPLRRIQKRTQYVLPPGGRVDFLVRLSRPGQYKMMKRRFQGRARDHVLASIDVQGKPLDMALPKELSALPPFLNPITDAEVTRRRILRFQICPDQARGDTCKHYPEAKLCGGPGMDGMIKSAFLIDGKPYDPDRIDHSIRLGTAEEWEIVNETGAEHPFHIHVNHFQVVQEGVPPEGWVWQDTISLPADRSVKIRSRFRTFPGRYLLHCHILLHSDLGMMQNVEVLGDGVEPCKPG